MVHENSMICYRETSVERSQRRQEILSAFEKADRPLSDREVMQMIGKFDPNTTRPRCTELIDEGILVEVGSTIDPFTKRRVRLTQLKEKQLVLY